MKYILNAFKKIDKFLLIALLLASLLSIYAINWGYVEPFESDPWALNQFLPNSILEPKNFKSPHVYTYLGLGTQFL